MNKILKIILLIYFSFIPLFEVFSQQSEYKIGGFPHVEVSFFSKKKLNLNIKLTSQQVFFQKNFYDADLGYEYGKTEFSPTLNYSAWQNQAIGAGYLLSHKSDALVHRLLQKYEVSAKGNIAKLKIRLQLEQNFQENTSVEIRYRVRNGLEFKNSEKFYTKTNFEGIIHLQNSKFAPELRFYFGQGFKINPKHRFELGLDYRSEFTYITKNQLWLRTNWKIKI